MRRLMPRALFEFASMAALTAAALFVIHPGGFRLIDGNGDTVESGLTYEACRVARPDLIDAVCVPPSARLIGLGCDGFDYPMFAAEESDFPACRVIRPL